jgi:hypothetical protein
MFGNDKDEEDKYRADDDKEFQILEKAEPEKKEKGKEKKDEKTD